MAIKAFATPEEYTAAYGAVADEKRLEALLMRATGYLRSKLDCYWEGYDEVLDLNLSTVCMAMVNRALSVPMGMSGVSQLSQTAGSYTAQATFFDQYMRPLPSELELLGLNSGAVASCRMQAGGRYDAD